MRSTFFICIWKISAIAVVSDEETCGNVYKNGIVFSSIYFPATITKNFHVELYLLRVISGIDIGIGSDQLPETMRLAVVSGQMQRRVALGVAAVLGLLVRANEHLEVVHVAWGYGN